MPYRATFFFQYQGDRLGGWSESFWNSNTSIDPMRARALSLAAKLAVAKAPGVLLTQIRISIPGTPRNVTPIIMDPPLTSGPFSLTSTYVADYQQTKYLIRLLGPKPAFGVPGSNQVQQWFGGIPDNAIVGAFLQYPYVLSSGFAPVQTELTSSTNGWSLNVLDPSKPPVAIAAINETTGVVTCAGAINFPNGSLVRVSRIHNLTSANGLWRVTVNPSDNTQFTLNNWVADTNKMKVSPKANVRWQTYTLMPILTMVPIRSSNHKVGRPIGQFGGRKKTRQ